jgi:hypothetical protein
MQLDNEFRDAQLKGLLLDPSVANPNTTSIQQTKDDNSTPTQKALTQLQSDRNMVMQKIKLGEAYHQPTTAWINELWRIDNQIREAAKDASKEQADNAQQIAQVLRDVNSTESLGAALQHIHDTYGPQKAQDIDRKLPHDGSGVPIWNETAKQVLTPYVGQYTSMHEKAMQVHRSNEVAIQAATLEERVRSDRERERETTARLAQERELGYARIKAADKRADAIADRFSQNMDYKVTREGIAASEKIAEQYKIRDYRKGVEVADSTAAKLTDPARGYADVTAPQARELADQFKLMIDNYRARTGGKYQEAELSKMNGLLQKLDKFTETIGEGDKILAKDVMLQTARVMQNSYTNRVTDLAKEELKMLNSVKDRRGNPMVVTPHFEVEDLEKRDAAIKVNKDGKDYLLFVKPESRGKKKKTQADFDQAIEMPSAPEVKQGPILIPTGD